MLAHFFRYPMSSDGSDVDNKIALKVTLSKSRDRDLPYIFESMMGLAFSGYK